MSGVLISGRSYFVLVSLCLAVVACGSDSPSPVTPAAPTPTTSAVQVRASRRCVGPDRGRTDAAARRDGDAEHGHDVRRDAAGDVAVVGARRGHRLVDGPRDRGGPGRRGNQRDVSERERHDGRRRAAGALRRVDLPRDGHVRSLRRRGQRAGPGERGVVPVERAQRRALAAVRVRTRGRGQRELRLHGARQQHDRASHGQHRRHDFHRRERGARDHGQSHHGVQLRDGPGGSRVHGRRRHGPVPRHHDAQQLPVEPRERHGRRSASRSRRASAERAPRRSATASRRIPATSMPTATSRSRACQAPIPTVATTSSFGSAEATRTRSDSIGSMREARQAGTKPAMRPTAIRMPAQTPSTCIDSTRWMSVDAGDVVEQLGEERPRAEDRDQQARTARRRRARRGS